MYLNKNIKELNILLFLSIFTAFFSIAKIGFNPTYLIGFLMVFIYMLFIIYTGKIQKNTLIFLFLFLFLSTTQFIAYNLNISPEKTVLSILLFLYSILLAPVVLWILSHISSIQKIKIYKIILIILILFLFIELIIRIEMSGGLSSDFYSYKSGFIYFDSNFTGLVILNFLFLYYYLSKRNIYKASNLKFIILWILLFLTISRAAILAGLVSYIMFHSLKHIKLKSALLTGSILIVIIVLSNLFVSGISFVEYDGSFNSKFNIIFMGLSFYDEQFSLYNKLFGIGLGNTKYFLGIFAHNIFITFIFEFGILGSLIFIYFLYKLSQKTNGMAFIIIVPNLIAGFSLFSAYSTFLFVCLAILYHEENNIKRMGR